MQLQTLNAMVVVTSLLSACTATGSPRGATPALTAARRIEVDPHEAPRNVRRSDEKWGVIAITQDDVKVEETWRAVHLLEQEMDALQEWEVLFRDYRFPLVHHEHLSALYVAQHTRNPVPLSKQELTDLSRLLEQALTDVAHERYTKARGALEKVLERTSKALETVNRDQGLATQVLDACLFDVRIELATSGRQAAIVRAITCRQNVPDAPPSEDRHPEQVLSVLRAAEETLNVAPKSRIAVSSVSGQVCDVYLSGRFAGKTPYVLAGAGQRRYQVQVECDKGSVVRVHDIDLKAAPVELLVDTDFESVLHTTEDGVRLSYARSLPPYIVPRSFQAERPASGSEPMVDSTEGLFHERVLRHVAILASQLGLTHLVTVYVSPQDNDLVVDMYEVGWSDGPRQHGGRIPLERLGEARKYCERGPSHWAWTKVLIDEWITGSSLALSSLAERDLRERSERLCGASLGAPSINAAAQTPGAGDSP